MKWEVATAFENEPKFKQLMKEGWEPYAVLWLSGEFLHYFRRKK